MKPTNLAQLNIDRKLHRAVLADLINDLVTVNHEPEESRDHLFLACLYTYGLWLQVIGFLLRTAHTPDWIEILARILGSALDRLTYILLSLAFQMTIYYIWRDRNERRHTQKTRPAHQLAKLIDKTIRQHIISTRYYEKRLLEGLLQRWFGAYIGQL
ncbi:BnaC03g61810D [Brassica napus]|uniref:BnaC03g61810D protein n=2 Tax=Brassica napus TaxID=3708 RepID=A0A078HDH0_BRANA|nr:BnaC03g61810D [Brassica napus]